MAESRIKNIPLGEKAWASPFAAFIDDSSLCVLLDASWQCVPLYRYPYMLFVWHQEDGFYIAGRTKDEDPAFFVKALIVEKQLWNSHLSNERINRSYISS